VFIAACISVCVRVYRVSIYSSLCFMYLFYACLVFCPPSTYSFFVMYFLFIYSLSILRFLFVRFALLLLCIVMYVFLVSIALCRIFYVLFCISLCIYVFMYFFSFLCVSVFSRYLVCIPLLSVCSSFFSVCIYVLLFV